MLNPDIKIAKSKGVDLPILYIYLAGRICGEHIDKCLKWRQDIINHYKNYKKESEVIQTELGPQERTYYTSYPISFLCPLNSGEANSVDKSGLTSKIPPNLIYDKDLLSVQKADVIVANMEDFFEEDIQEELTIISDENCEEGDIIDKIHYWEDTNNSVITKKLVVKDVDFKQAFYKLQQKILNRRPNWGTDSEIAWTLYLKKPLILIAGNKRNKEMLEKHPFMKRASAIVLDVNELLEKKWLNILYKSISGAIYE